MTQIQIGDGIGDYRVIDMAGSGGMGTVYKIEHVITRRVEAMKLLPPGSSNDPEQLHRFEREIQVQARLHHPNIVTLYNAIRDGDSVALVMEFVEGESLQRKLEGGALPIAAAVDYAAQVLGALAYAHESGVIHRDVSPANIIVTSEGVAKLSDFGLARGAADLRLSASGTPVGSPWYMSPEQVKGLGPLDVRTDLYAMGAVLHEMLTGAKLFDAEGAFAVMRAQVETEPLPPSSRNPAIPPALDEIVRRAVAKDPAMRFQSADEFRLALAAIDAPVPVARSRRALRVAAFAAAAALVVAGGLAATRLLPRVEPPKLVVPLPRIAAAPPLVAPAAPALEEKQVAAPAAATRVAATRTPARKQERYAIRVTGGDPLPQPPPRPALETVSAEIPMTEPAAVLKSAPKLPIAAPEPAPAKPQGNRFVRALGKVNPFRKKS